MVERRDQEGVLVGLRLVPHPDAFVLIGPASEADQTRERSVVVKVGDATARSAHQPCGGCSSLRNRRTLSELRQADPAPEITELWNLIIQGLLAENPI